MIHLKLDIEPQISDMLGDFVVPAYARRLKGFCLESVIAEGVQRILNCDEDDATEAVSQWMQHDTDDLEVYGFDDLMLICNVDDEDYIKYELYEVEYKYSMVGA